MLQISRDTLAQAIDLIQGLDPEPGQNLAPKPVTYVTPDVIAIDQQRQWTVRLNSNLYPSVRLDPSYSTQLKRTRDADSLRYLQKHLQDARWLIRSLDQRHQTILRIAAEIIWRQQRFVTHGEL